MRNGAILQNGAYATWRLRPGLLSKSTVGGTVLSIKLLTILSGQEEARDGKGKSSIR